MGEYNYGTIIRGTELDAPTITVSGNTPDNFITLARNNGIDVSVDKNGNINGYTYRMTEAELTDNGSVDKVYYVNMVPQKDANSTADNVIINYVPSGAYTVDTDRKYEEGGIKVIVSEDEYIKSALKCGGVNLDLAEVDPAQLAYVKQRYSELCGEYLQPTMMDSDPIFVPTSTDPKDMLNGLEATLKKYTDSDDPYMKTMINRENLSLLYKACAEVGWFTFEDIIEDDPETKAIMINAQPNDYIKLVSPYDPDEPPYTDFSLWKQAFIRPYLYCNMMPGIRPLPSLENPSIWADYKFNTVLIPLQIQDDINSIEGNDCNLLITQVMPTFQEHIRMEGIHVDATQEYRVHANDPSKGYAVIDLYGTPEPSVRCYWRQYSNNVWAGEGSTDFNRQVILVYDHVNFLAFLENSFTLGDGVGLSLLNGNMFLYANCEYIPHDTPGITHDTDVLVINRDTPVADINTAIVNSYPDWWDVSIPESEYDPKSDTTVLKYYMPVGINTDSPKTADSEPSVIEKYYPYILSIPTAGASIVPGLPDPDTETSGLVSCNKFWTLYNPSDVQMDQLGGVLWDQNVIDILKQTFINPTDGIISYGQVYFNVATTTTKQLVIGNYPTGITGVSVLDTAHYILDFPDALTIPRYYNDYRDYTDTKVMIYLPFVGWEELDPNDVVGCVLKLKYHIDMITGTCIAEIISYPYLSDVTVWTSGSAIGHYIFQGNCMVQLPITSNDRSRLLSGLLNGVIGGAKSGAMIGGGAGGIIGGIAGGLLGGITHSFGDVNQKGNFSANAGALSEYKTPYVSIQRKIPVDPINYNLLKGNPAYDLRTLNGLHGYVECSEVRLDIPGATDTELEMIRASLRSGVIV